METLENKTVYVARLIIEEGRKRLQALEDIQGEKMKIQEKINEMVEKANKLVEIRDILTQTVNSVEYFELSTRLSSIFNEITEIYQYLMSRSEIPVDIKIKIQDKYDESYSIAENAEKNSQKIQKMQESVSSIFSKIDKFKNLYTVLSNQTNENDYINFYNQEIIPLIKAINSDGQYIESIPEISSDTKTEIHSRLQIIQDMLKNIESTIEALSGPRFSE